MTVWLYDYITTNTIGNVTTGPPNIILLLEQSWEDRPPYISTHPQLSSIAKGIKVLIWALRKKRKQIVFPKLLESEYVIVFLSPPNAC